MQLGLAFLMLGLTIILNYRDQWSLVLGGLVISVSIPLFLFGSYRLFQQWRMKKKLNNAPSPADQLDQKGE